MDNNLILKRFFTKSMFHNLISLEDEKLFVTIIKRYISNPDGKDYASLISEIYSFMGKEYRTEYFYKNTLLNKLLFQKHHNYKKTIALTELPICNSKADFIMINGKGIVYEIKTELDNLERLQSQIKDYYKAFSNVVIVSYEDNIEKIKEIVPNSVGLMILTKRNALRSIRSPKEEKRNFDYNAIFKILRKYEFEEILVKYFKHLPETIQFNYYKECLKMLEKIDINVLQKEMLSILKKRTKIEVVEQSLSVPYELRSILYFKGMSDKDFSNIDNVLQKKFGEVE